MNSLPRPRTEPEALAQVDQLLERYFTAEVPQPWPTAPRVAPMTRRRFTMRREYLALAASFLLALGCWWGCGLTRGTVAEPVPGIKNAEGGTAQQPLGPRDTAKHNTPRR